MVAEALRQDQHARPERLDRDLAGQPLVEVESRLRRRCRARATSSSDCSGRRSRRSATATTMRVGLDALRRSRRADRTGRASGRRVSVPSSGRSLSTIPATMKRGLTGRLDLLDQLRRHRAGAEDQDPRRAAAAAHARRRQRSSTDGRQQDQRTTATAAPGPGRRPASRGRAAAPDRRRLRSLGTMDMGLLLKASSTLRWRPATRPGSTPGSTRRSSRRAAARRG